MSQDRLNFNVGSYFILQALSLLGANRPKDFKILSAEPSDGSNDEGGIQVSMSKLEAWLQENTNPRLRNLSASGLFQVQFSDGEAGCSWRDLNTSIQQTEAERQFIKEYNRPVFIIQKPLSSQIVKTSSGSYFKKVKTETGFDFKELGTEEVKKLEKELGIETLANNTAITGLIGGLISSVSGNYSSPLKKMKKNSSKLVQGGAGRQGVGSELIKSFISSIRENSSNADSHPLPQTKESSDMRLGTLLLYSGDRSIYLRKSLLEQVGQWTRPIIEGLSAHRSLDLEFGGKKYHFSGPHEKTAYPTDMPIQPISYQGTNECVTASILNAWIAQGNTMYVDARRLGMIHDKFLEVQKNFLLEPNYASEMDQFLSSLGLSEFPPAEVWQLGGQQSLAVEATYIPLLWAAIQAGKVPGVEMEIVLPKDGSSYYNIPNLANLKKSGHQLIVQVPLEDMSNMDHVMHVSSLNIETGSISVMDTLEGHERQIALSKQMVEIRERDFPRFLIFSIYFTDPEAFQIWLDS